MYEGRNEGTEYDADNKLACLLSELLMTHLLQEKQPERRNVFQMEVAMFAELRKWILIDVQIRNMYDKCRLTSVEARRD